jgi:hypothetical protein
MPYIVTTKYPIKPLGASGIPFDTRTAVATLNEARGYVNRSLDGHGSHERGSLRTFAITACRLPTRGGTVGPLPDGTVIEVRKAAWAELAENLHADTNEMTCGEVLDLFNAQGAVASGR